MVRKYRFISNKKLGQLLIKTSAIVDECTSKNLSDYQGISITELKNQISLMSHEQQYRDEIKVFSTLTKEFNHQERKINIITHSTVLIIFIITLIVIFRYPEYQEILSIIMAVLSIILSLLSLIRIQKIK